jgi:hypothetical protein
MVLIRLVWTAPGDDGNVGKALKYEMRYSTTAPNPDDMDRWWSRASVVAGVPPPDTAGAEQGVSLWITDNTSHYFNIRTVDDAGNLSSYSNTALVIAVTDSLSPYDITDLRKP